MALYYVMALGASVCYSLQFVCMKFYQRHVKNNLFTSLVFGAVVMAISGIVILILNAVLRRALYLTFTPFTLIVAAGLALVTVLSTVVGIAVMKKGKLSVYSNFTMLGGMALPFVFGLAFMGEKMTVWKVVGMAVMALSLFLAMRDGKGEEQVKGTVLFYLLCFAQFTLNGSASIFSAVQANAETVFGQEVTDVFDFVIWSRIFTVGISAVMFGIAAGAMHSQKEELLAVKEVFGKKATIPLIGYAIVSLAGLLLAMSCMGEGRLDASSLYPITTGGTIVLSAVFGRILFKEKITPYMAVCLLLTVAASVAFMF